MHHQNIANTLHNNVVPPRPAHRRVSACTQCTVQVADCYAIRLLFKTRNTEYGEGGVHDTPGPSSHAVLVHGC